MKLRSKITPFLITVYRKHTTSKSPTFISHQIQAKYLYNSGGQHPPFCHSTDVPPRLFSVSLWFACGLRLSSFFTMHVKLAACRPNMAFLNSFGDL
jgi:hypothetical protein